MTNQTLLTAVAAHGLTTISTPEPAPIPAEVWDRLIVSAREQRLIPLLARFLRDLDFPLTAVQRDELEAAAFDWAATGMALEAFAVDVVHDLDASGIPYRLLKGPALARLDYAVPGDRAWADVDVLVPGHRFDDAVALFAGLGFDRPYPQPRRGFDRRFSKGAELVAPDGFELDLHRTWVSGPYAQLIDADDLFSRSEPFELAGRLCHALSREDRVLHACFHAGIADDPPRLLPFRDLAELLLRPFDVETVRGRARAWRATGVTSLAVRRTWKTLGIATPSPLGRGAQERIPYAERLWVSSYAGSSYPVELLAALTAIRGLGAKAAYLRAVLLPDRAYVDGRHASNLRRFAHGGAELLRWTKASSRNRRDPANTGRRTGDVS